MIPGSCISLHSNVSSSALESNPILSLKNVFNLYPDVCCGSCILKDYRLDADIPLFLSNIF